ncbi:MAG: recA, partial [bacterium]|nr:recA [bacterium]
MKDDKPDKNDKTNIASRTGRDAAIELAVSGIEKQFGKGSNMRLGAEQKPPEVQVIPTGSLAL